MVSIWRILALREELRTQVRSQIEGQVTDAVAAWEDDITGKLNEWQEQASADPVSGWLSEVRMRQKQPWFDSLYLWRPRRVTTSHGKIREEPAQFLFPLDAPKEQDSLRGAACLRGFDESAEAEDPIAAVAAYLDGCKAEPLPVRLKASSEGADRLLRDHLADAAMGALDASGIDPDTTLRAGIQQGLDPYRLVILRLERYDCLLELGREDDALELLTNTGLEIAALDAPELEHRLEYLSQKTLQQLDDHDRHDDAQRVLRAIQQAQRRMRAWDEIRERILPRPPQQASEAPRFIYDQYSTTPFLLYYGLVRDGEMGCALQLDQPMLVADFLASMRRYRDYIVITDASGSFVAGQRKGSAIAVQVPFAHTLTHLRVGIREDAIDARLERLDNQWFIPLVVVVVVVVLGIAALIAQVRADRQQMRLLARQAEFTQRVTHELKTPLAGIRVMAENLESGAYASAADARDMARSIVREADRLGRRVEEILAVAKARSIPDPKPFDPEEVALEAIDSWGPRLEAAGVKLEADLDAAPEVRGDADAVRDALGCLLDNALKYRDEARPDPHVWLTLRHDGADVVFEVSDNGLGVPVAMREAIFDRFVRVEGPNRGMAGGHGLGLAQVRDIATEHGGTVACTDGVDGGAKFTLRLPAIRG
jgi:signal transduction histidine kinase